MKATNVARYLQLVSELKMTRDRENEILDRMDLLWQVMTLEERESIHAINPTWPPPVRKQEDDNGNG